MGRRGGATESPPGVEAGDPGSRIGRDQAEDSTVVAGVRSADLGVHRGAGGAGQAIGSDHDLVMGATGEMHEDSRRPARTEVVVRPQLIVRGSTAVAPGGTAG